MSVFLWAWLATANADSVCAKSHLTLYANPKPSAAVTWRAAKHMPFVRLDQKNEWSKLRDLDGAIHYAHARDITAKVRCVVVKVQTATLRKEPSARAATAELRTVDKYTPFLRLEDKSGWIQIKDEANHVAWIQKSQVWTPVTVNSISF